MHSRKNPFSLLEVIVALGLLAACLPLLLAVPSRALQSQRRALAALEGERLLDLAYAEVREGLYAGAYESESLVKGATRKLSAMQGNWAIKNVTEGKTHEGNDIKCLELCFTLTETTPHQQGKYACIIAR